jgi:hypothetical protein
VLDSGELKAEVGRLQSFVAAQRQLEFTAPVPVVVLDAKAFAARVRRLVNTERSGLGAYGRQLQALDLLPRDVDLVQQTIEMVSLSYVALFDPGSGELLVQDTPLTPYLRGALVHELTHALDHQHYDLNRTELRGDAALAFLALAEGDAVRIEDDYVGAMNQADALRRNQEERARGGFAAHISPVVFRLLALTYGPGRSLVDAVVGARGEEGLGAAFERPPATTEQVYEPATFIDHQPVVSVASPPADGPDAERGVLGLWVLNLLLSPHVSPEEAREAVLGWAGGSYAAWAQGEQRCLRATVATDSRADADQLIGALRLWANTRPSTPTAISSKGASVTFSTCS